MPVKFHEVTGQLLWTCDFCAGAASDWVSLGRLRFTIGGDEYREVKMIRWAHSALERLATSPPAKQSLERIRSKGLGLVSSCEGCQKKWWDAIMDAARREVSG